MDYVMSVRSIRQGAFSDEPGATHFLEIPGNASQMTPAHSIKKTRWLEKILDASKKGAHGPVAEGDIVVYVHGFNTSQKTVLKRLRSLRAGLEAHGFSGVVIGFDWPSASQALNYLEDRTDAKQTAFRLVDEGIRSFAALQRPDCRINTHILAHSMGCYVVREAFDDADDRPAIASHAWSVSQVILLGADVSSTSLSEGHSKSSSLYRHSVRVTNYFNPHDDVLSLSDIKRVGVAPRAGRIGVNPVDPAQLVDLDCGGYYVATYGGDGLPDQKAHTFYFEDDWIMRDMALTLDGKIDRYRIPSRVKDAAGRLVLGLPVTA